MFGNKPVNFIYKGEAIINGQVDNSLLVGKEVWFTYQKLRPDCVLCKIKKDNSIIYLPFEKLDVKTMVDVTPGRHLDGVTDYLDQ